MPAVDLVLSDNSVYPEKGKIEIAEGQFDRQPVQLIFVQHSPMQMEYCDRVIPVK
jgi:hypothetical protein